MCSEENKECQETTVETCKMECEELKNKYFHLSADFQNYKRRLVQERADWGYEAQKGIILDILTVMDDFERAFAQEKKHAEADAVLTGFSLIYQALEKMLKKYDVLEITEHGVFNPEYHEALMHVDSPDHASGDIVDVMQKGYMFKGRVLRPATVSVAK